ncbi:unnamed protein product [Larinioides sclopetarius]|uniref:Uncharacterized protein n=1 Tax=Larinioides sclopetarius TaxID=280406 RepID=A0AAV1ZH40_9ARAC
MNKEKRNWDSNLLYASFGPILPILTNCTGSKKMPNLIRRKFNYSIQ